VILALTPLVSVTMALSAFAATGGTDPTTTVTTTPAPPGDASASAVDIDGIISAGKTTAHAGSDGGSAHADALDLLGTRVSGGDQTSAGSNSGNLIGTGDTPLGDAEVAPWSTKVTDDNGGHQSAAEAAVAHLNLGGLAEIWLLHSKSSATWTPDKSTGDAESDGAEVSALGMLDIKVLHSEAHSGQTGKSDLLVVNGTEIGSSDQANGQCEINAEPLVDLLCLTASGGTSSTGVSTSDGTVAQIDVGNGQLGGVISGSSTKGGVAAPPQQPTVQKPAQGHQTEGSRVPNTPSAPSAAGLPFTGADIQRMGAIATALAALGGAMTAFARRRRTSLAA
jgi:hypothetical protein